MNHPNRAKVIVTDMKSFGGFSEEHICTGSIGRLNFKARMYTGPLGSWKWQAIASRTLSLPERLKIGKACMAYFWSPKGLKSRKAA